MCGLCGVFGGAEHWAEGSATPAAPALAAGATHRQARQVRTRTANKVLAHYHLKLDDWMGSAYLLRSRTGATIIVPHLGALWPAVERLTKRPVDPLDPALLATLDAEPPEPRRAS